MNFGQMLTGLYDDLTYQTTPAVTITTRLKRWINEGHQHALRLSGLVGLRQGTIPFVSRQGQAAYGFPQVFERIDAIVEQQNDRRLLYRTRDWYRALDPGERSEGTPMVWIDEGLQPVIQQPDHTGVWAISEHASDTTQIVKMVGVRANGDLQVEASAMLTGTTAVQLGSIVDYVRILSWELSAPALGTVRLVGNPALSFSAQPVIDDFDRPNENPLSFGGKWQTRNIPGTEPLALITNQVGPSNVDANNSSFWYQRLQANFDAYITVAVLPADPLAEFGPFNNLGMGFAVDFNVAPIDRTVGFYAGVQTQNIGPGGWFLFLVVNNPTQRVMIYAPVDFQPGDGLGLSRRESLFTLYHRQSGIWRPVGQATETAYQIPLYFGMGIADENGLIHGAARIDDVSAGPMEGMPIWPPPSRILARMPIGRTHVQYQGVRLWPTPTADLTYTVDGQFLIPELVNPTDVPMLPESHQDMLLCYARFRQYKFNGDETRAVMEHTEWIRWMGSLQAYVEYPQDYRPVMGAHTEDGLRWTNLPGGVFPADGWGR